MNAAVVRACLDPPGWTFRYAHHEVAEMLVQAGRPLSAHVVVLGNEKGGSGKATTAMHVTVALLNVGQRVATIDLDSPQKSFTHYIENRRNWAARAGIAL